MMTIVVNAEEKFGVRIPDNEVKNLRRSATPSPSSQAPRADASPDGRAYPRVGRPSGGRDSPVARGAG